MKVGRAENPHISRELEDGQNPTSVTTPASQIPIHTQPVFGRRNRNGSDIPLRVLIMITLSTSWAQELVSQPETGMGYQIASIYLKNGQRYDQVMAVEGRITSIKDDHNIPFTEADIERIVVTHNKWK